MVRDTAVLRAPFVDAEFSSLLARHGAALGRVAASYARSRADREDLLQEIALALFRALPSFRGESSEKTFVYRVAHNQGITFATRRRAHALAGDDPPEAADERPDPEAQLGAARRQAQLMNAVRELPVGQRQVLTMALDGLTHEEIGEVLGITANNVGVRLSRARDTLRALLVTPKGEP